MATSGNFMFGGWTPQTSTPVYDGNYHDSLRGGVPQYTPSADSRLIYVSSTGDDGTGTVTDIATQTSAFEPTGTVLPYLTLSAAKAQMRDGFPDWILLKRGDTWTNENFGELGRSGRSITEPLLLTYYGATGDRPVIEIARNTGLSLLNDRNHITVFGLDFYGHTRDPSHPNYTIGGTGDPAFLFVGTGSNITIDETILRFSRSGVSIVGFGGTYNNVILRRNMILDAYSYNSISHSQGFYISDAVGILIEDNLFDHNGWNETDPTANATQFNHNVYMQTGSTGTITVRNNISMRASSHGFQVRTGGDVRDNFMFENSISLLMGNHDAGTWTGTAQDNVMLEGKSMGGGVGSTPAIWGVMVETVDPVVNGTAFITNNIVAHVRDTNGVLTGIQRHIPDIIYTSNIVYDWNPPEDMSDGTWLDPERDIEGYMSSIGETATYAAFIAALRSRGIGEWDERFEATAVNTYFQEGFNK